MDNGESYKKERNGNGGSSESKSGGHRSRHSSSRHWIISPLWIGIVAEGLVIAGLAIWGALLDQENQAHYLREKTLAETINDSKKELEGIRWEFNEFKNQRDQTCFPNMLQLKFDQILEINREYIKSGIFMVVGTKDKRDLEYKIVLKNNRQGNITPLVDIVFFNALGNQIGVSHIGSNNDGKPTGEVLAGGEVRSFDGVLDLTNVGQPEYVMFKIRDGK
jgi:hypothetical protein